MGAHLVAIETAEENMILTEIVKNFTKGKNGKILIIINNYFYSS